VGEERCSFEFEGEINMGSWYWISGVQLGMLIAATEFGHKEAALILLKKIEEEQDIGSDMLARFFK
jgi:hypothetical protein